MRKQNIMEEEEDTPFINNKEEEQKYIYNNLKIKNMRVAE